MSKLIAFVLVILSTAQCWALEGIGNTQIYFMKNLFEVPGGMMVIATGDADQDMLIVKYSKAQGKDYIGFWDETENPLFKAINCPLNDFLNHAYSGESSPCESSKVEAFKDEFVTGWESGYLDINGGRYYYTESEQFSTVFYLDNKNRIIHLDSDCMDKNRLISLRSPL